MFYQSLVSRGVPTAMVIYPNEGHGIRQPRHQADVLRRVLAWFAAHGGEPVGLEWLGGRTPIINEQSAVPGGGD